MEEEINCENCKRSVSISNFTTHSAHCVRKIDVCNVCNETVPKADMSAHIDEMHVYVKCEKCLESMQKWKLLHHQESLCVKRDISCKYCELIKPWNEIKEHELYCGSRTEKCPECWKFIPIKELKQHALTHSVHVTENNKVEDKKPKSFDTMSTKAPKINIPEEEFEIAKKVFENNKVEDKKPKSVNTKSAKAPRIIIPEKEFEIAKKAFPVPQVNSLLFKSKFTEPNDHIVNSCNKRDGIATGNDRDPLKKDGECAQKNYPSDEQKFEQKEKVLPEHVNDMTSSTTLQETSAKCQWCFISVKESEFQKHAQECGYARISCTYCDLKMMRSSSKYHNCSKNTRNFIEGVTDSKEKHEKVFERCKWCPRVLEKSELQKHYEECIYADVSCIYCEEKVKRHNLNLHKINCLHRITSDEGSVINNKENYEVASERCKHCCKYYKKSEIQKHDQECEYAETTCSRCNEKMIRYRLKYHTMLCQPKISNSNGGCDTNVQVFPVLDSEECVWCDIRINKSEFNAHLSKCFNEDVSCNFCGKNKKRFELRDHQKKCQKNNISKHKDEDADVDTRVPESISEKCEWCENLFAKSQFERHVELCAVAEVQCTICGEKVQRYEVKEHQMKCTSNDSDNSNEGSHTDVEVVSQMQDFETCRWCDKNIKKLEFNEHFQACMDEETSCYLCDKKMKRYKLKDHQIKCQLRNKSSKQMVCDKDTKEVVETPQFANCSRCLQSYEKSKLQKHLKECEPTYKFCKYCNGEFLRHDYKKHKKTCQEKMEGCNRKAEEPQIQIAGYKVKMKFENFDDSQVSLDTYKSDLNLVIDGSRYSSRPLTHEGFAFMWAGARATHGIKHGKICFEVKLTKNIDVSHLPADEPNPHVLRVGFSVENSTLQLGEDPLSYGYGGTGKISTNCQFRNYGSSFGEGDVIMGLLNMDSNPVEIGFAKNGVFLGWAYKVPKKELDGQPLFPHILTKNIEFEVNFGQMDKPYFKCPSGYESFKFIGCVPADKRERGTKGPSRREDCEQSPFKCAMCFKVVTNIEDHTQNCHPSEMHCDTCKKSVLPSAYIKYKETCKRKETKDDDEANSNKDDEEPEQCPFCNKFCEKFELESHKLECPLRMYECEFCEFSFMAADLARHSKNCKIRGSNFEKIGKQATITTLDVTNGLTTCKTCDQEMSLLEYQSHMSDCARTFKECLICKQKMPASQLYIHKESCKNSNVIARKTAISKDNIVTCQFCKENFTQKQHGSHMVSCGQKLIRCPSCGDEMAAIRLSHHQAQCFPQVTFKEKETFNGKEKEMAIKTENEADMIECTTCNETFTSKAFSHHVLPCSKKLVVCSICDEEMASSSLSLHQIKMHSRDAKPNNTVANCRGIDSRNTSIPDDISNEMRYKCNVEQTKLTLSNTSLKVSISKHSTDSSSEGLKISAASHSSLQSSEHLRRTVSQIPEPLFNNAPMLMSRSTHKEKDTNKISGHSKTDSNGFDQSNKIVAIGTQAAERKNENAVKQTSNHASSHTCSFCKNTYASFQDFIEHYDGCDFRMSRCLYCSEEVQETQIKDHQAKCAQSSQFPSRDGAPPARDAPLPPIIQSGQLPFDSRIPVNDADVNFVVMVSCPMCTEQFTTSEIDGHAQICKMKQQTNKSLQTFNQIPDSPEYAIERDSIKLEVNDIPVSCPLCNNLYPLINIDDHGIRCAKQYKNSVKLTCPICEEKYLVVDIDGHIAECRKKSYALICSVCDKRFSTHEINNHITKCKSESNDEIKFTCLACKEQLEGDVITLHIDYCMQKSKISTKLECLMCKKKFMPDVIDDHIASCCHETVKCIKVNCPKCDEPFLTSEIDNHTLKCQPKQMCLWCQIKYPIAVIETHVINCDKRIEQCMKCGKDMIHSELKPHQQICFQNHDAALDMHGSVYGDIEQQDVEKAKEAITLSNLVKCACGETFPESQMEYHLKVCPVMRSSITESSYSHLPKEQQCTTCRDMIPSSEIVAHEKICFSRNYHMGIIDGNEFTAYGDFLESDGVFLCKLCEEPVTDLSNHSANCRRFICLCCQNKFSCDAINAHAVNCKTQNFKSADHAESKNLGKNLENTCKSCERTTPKPCDCSRDHCNKDHIGNRNQGPRESKESSVTGKPGTVPCQLCDNSIPFYEYEEHIRKCMYRKRQCPHCLVDILMRDYKNHVEMCFDTNHDQNQKGSKKDKQAKRNSSNKNMKLCQYCNKHIHIHDYEAHAWKCDENRLPCPYCSVLVPRRLHSNHVNRCYPRQEDRKDSEFETHQNKGGGIVNKISKFWNKFNFTASDVELSPVPGHQNPYSFDQSNHERNQEDRVPCEFCNKMIHLEDFISHSTGCKPETTSYAVPPNDGKEMIPMQQNATNDMGNIQYRMENLPINDNHFQTATAHNMSADEYAYYQWQINGKDYSTVTANNGKGYFDDRIQQNITKQNMPPPYQYEGNQQKGEISYSSAVTNVRKENYNDSGKRQNLELTERNPPPYPCANVQRPRTSSSSLISNSGESDSSIDERKVSSHTESIHPTKENEEYHSAVEPDDENICDSSQETERQRHYNFNNTISDSEENLKLLHSNAGIDYNSNEADHKTQPMSKLKSNKKKSKKNSKSEEVEYPQDMVTANKFSPLGDSDTEERASRKNSKTHFSVKHIVKKATSFNKVDGKSKEKTKPKQRKR